MISEISAKLYTILRDDATLTAMLPSVKDGTNIWEMRVPKELTKTQYPVVVFRVTTGAPLLEVKSLNALNWFIEIDIISNTASMINLMAIYERIYDLLEDGNLTSGAATAYKCKLDFFNTDYDANTLIHFILTRWQIWSIENPNSKLNDLG